MSSLAASSLMWPHCVDSVVDLHCCDHGGGHIVLLAITIVLLSCHIHCGHIVVVVITIVVMWSLSQLWWCSPCCYHDHSYGKGSTASRKCQHFPHRGSRGLKLAGVTKGVMTAELEAAHRPEMPLP